MAAVTASRRLVFTLAELPPRELSPNGPHGHWAGAAAARSWFRRIVAVRVREQLEALGRRRPAPYARASVAVTAHVHRAHRAVLPAHAARYRPEDVPNLVSALKPLYDGLQDAGVLVGDRAEQMVLGEHAIVVVGSFADEGLIVEVRPLAV